MARATVAVTIDEQTLREVDRWVAEGEYPNRRQAMQAAVRCLPEKRTRL